MVFEYTNLNYYNFFLEFSTSLLYAGENKTFRLKGVIAHQYKVIQ